MASGLPTLDPAAALELRAESLTLAYQEAHVFDELNLTVPTGLMTALVGANGSGKSTLLKAMARLMHPRAGAVLLDGEAIVKMPTREIARRLAILPQGPQAPDGLTVGELVGFGRYPHRRALGGTTVADRQAISEALDITGMRVFESRPVSSLSGGQRQRAWIAMALAQQTDVLLLDEPTTFLDMAHQIEVLELLARLNREQGRTIVMVLHDLNHASRYAQHLVGIAGGEVVVEGPPESVVTPDNLRRIFAVEAHVIPDPHTGCPLCVPYGLHPHGNRDIGL